jgi:D-inositol-3-phosphate glycosyltransferase
MRVGLFTPYYLPVVGGSELYVHDLAHFLKGKGYEVSIFATNVNLCKKSDLPIVTKENSSIQIRRVRVLEKSRKFTKAFISSYIPAENFIREVNRRHFDILHFHNLTDLTFPTFLAHSKKPKILTCHTIYEVVNYHYIVGPRLFFFRRILNLMDVLHVLSNRDIKLLSRLRLESKKIIIIPPGVDTRRFNSSPNREGNKVLFVGRISPEKGIETLLKALSVIDSDFELWLIGPLQDLKYFYTLKEKFSRMFNEGKIRFLGSLAYDKLAEYYAKADIFVLPSKMESFGLVLLEAMASRLPVISTNVGVASELIEEWKNGFIVPICDWKAMAERIELLLTDKKLRAEMGETNRKIVEEKYDAYKNFEKVVRLYERMIFDNDTLIR